MSEDPIGFEGQDLNLYAYVKNNPINFTDPFGLQLEPSPERDALHCVLPIFAFEFFKLNFSSTPNSDKWYHCMANCISVRRCGGYGLGAAEGVGDFKEYLDCNFETGSCDPLDTEANRQGRTSKGQCCEKTCERYNLK